MKRLKPTSIPNLLSGEQRLNKLLAAAGLGSRRQVDELIEQGRVEIDGVVCDQLGRKVDSEVAKITVDGTALKKIRPVYYALNKPAGVLCTNRDPQGRRRAIDFIPGHQRLFPVGRLDASSVGLLLLTNDGELTQQLTHPRHGVPKTYHVVVAGQMDPNEIRRLRRGIYLSEGIARVEFVKIKHVRKNSTELEITLCEGKNREIRRVLARIGHKVVTLQRLSIGPLKLGNLPEAAYRPLSKEEIAALYRAAQDARQNRARRRSSRLPSKDEHPTAPSRETSPQSRPVRSKAIPPQRPKPGPTADALTPIHAERDPFAWDDDEELLAASPFTDHRRQPASDLADEDDDGWLGPADGIDDPNEQDSAPPAMDGDTILIDDRESMRTGRVLAYDDAKSNPKPAKGRGGKSIDSKRPTTAKKSATPKRGRAAKTPRGKGPAKKHGPKQRGFEQAARERNEVKRTDGKRSGLKRKSTKRSAAKKTGHVQDTRTSTRSSSKSAYRKKPRKR